MNTSSEESELWLMPKQNPRQRGFRGRNHDEHGFGGIARQALLRDLSGNRDRDLAPPMGEVDVEGALDVGGVLGIHSDTDGV